MRSRNVGARTPLQRQALLRFTPPPQWKKVIYHGGGWEMPFLSLGLRQEHKQFFRKRVLHRAGVLSSEGGIWKWESGMGRVPAGTECFE